MISRISRKRLPDQLAERLQRFIAEGNLTAGYRLPAMNELAARFNVGYPTLREGLKKLEALGIITIQHGSGVYVGQPSSSFFLLNPITVERGPTKKVLCDLIDARKAVELETIALAAQRITTLQVSSIERLLKDARRNLANEVFLNRINVQFHRELAVASGNSVLSQILDVTLRLFYEEQRVILRIHGSPAGDHEEHVQILQAVEAHKKTLAVARMRGHLEGVRNAIMKWNPGADRPNERM